MYIYIYTLYVNVWILVTISAIDIVIVALGNPLPNCQKSQEIGVWRHSHSSSNSSSSSRRSSTSRSSSSRSSSSRQVVVSLLHGVKWWNLTTLPETNIKRSWKWPKTPLLRESSSSNRRFSGEELLVSGRVIVSNMGCFNHFHKGEPAGDVSEKRIGLRHLCRANVSLHLGARKGWSGELLEMLGRLWMYIFGQIIFATSHDRLPEQ